MVERKKSNNYKAKCIVCGDSTVGKSALVQVFCSDGAQYPKAYNMTTGVDLVVKQLNIPGTFDTVELFIYDTAGKEIFSDIVEAHLQDVAMVVYVYDASNASSFERISYWHQLVNQDKKLPGVLIANKIDLTDRQCVSPSAGEELAKKLALTFFQCSAKNMEQTDAPFTHLARSFYEVKSIATVDDEVYN